MRSADVKVGAVYASKVGGVRVRVRVESEFESVSTRAGRLRVTTQFRCTNLSTGREVIRSAAALHAYTPPVEQTCKSAEQVRITYMEAMARS
jgi:hypothetical protein